MGEMPVAPGGGGGGGGGSGGGGGKRQNCKTRVVVSRSRSSARMGELVGPHRRVFNEFQHSIRVLREDRRGEAPVQLMGAGGPPIPDIVLDFHPYQVLALTHDAREQTPPTLGKFAASEQGVARAVRLAAEGACRGVPSPGTPTVARRESHTTEPHLTVDNLSVPKCQYMTLTSEQWHQHSAP